MELCEGLVLNASLQYLDLSSNNIDPNGAIQLGTALLSNSALVEVGMFTVHSKQLTAVWLLVVMIQIIK